ncbi:hypothetical protein FQA39_LY03052 [Lamprigera yunnana]|nr:hypothetical protein FQA39_LY03052 [Lamprigera yunnana]
MQDRTNKIKEWDKLIKLYISQQKCIREAGIVLIDKEVRHDVTCSKLKDALLSADATLLQLKQFFVPLLDVKDLFIENQLKIEVQKLAQVHGVLLTANSSLRTQNEDLEEDLRKAEDEHARIKECLEQEEQKDTQQSSEGIFQSMLKYNQERFDEELKKKNDALTNLKKELNESNKDKELARILNVKLQNELQKNKIEPFFSSITMADKEDKIREWTNVIKRHNAQHKYLGDVGKVFINKGENHKDAGTTLREALANSDQMLFKLKQCFTPLINEKNLFADILLHAEKEHLEKENKRLSSEQEDLTKENKKLKDNLQKLLETNETLNDDLLKKQQSRSIEPTEETFQLLARRNQEQFDNTLKIQDDLIATLKEQLDKSNKDKEEVRMLNTQLETELKKNVNQLQNATFDIKYPDLSGISNAITLGGEIKSKSIFDL